MAKSDNIFNIRAHGGNLIFCKLDGTNYVRRYSGGFTLATTQNHPNIKASHGRFALEMLKFKTRTATVFVAEEGRHSRGNNKEHSAKIGQFNRVAFKNSGEQIFDKLFGFDRLLKESVNYALTMKNGNADEKRVMSILDQLETNSSEKGIKVDLDMVKNGFAANTSETVELTDIIDSSLSDLSLFYFLQIHRYMKITRICFLILKRKGRIGGGVRGLKRGFLVNID